MNDQIALARLVFGIFQVGYPKRPARGHQLYSFDEEEATQLGITVDEIEIGLRVLVQKGLVKAISSDHYDLDDLGLEVCVHPETLDDYLGPRHVAPPAQHVVNVTAGQIHGSQVGGVGNVMNITYAQALTALADKIDSSQDIPKDKQRTWSTTLRDIAKSAVAGLTVQGVVKAIGAFTGHSH